MSPRERFWWAVLVRACEQQRTEIKRDVDACMRAREVELRARGELVKLGLDLDEVFPEADDEFLRLLKEVKEQEAAERKWRTDSEARMAEIDELLAKSER